ncbi:hypothetical protein FM115_07650 [Marinilactibacillus psychrotolerans 42ea]|uniref:Polysaccharide pyruvyl transferase domain-containing protein n=1 Tax=Marinilactibacillus psychrotolerans 42ea TaxID=1255609 RepID=A0A1R4K0V8_9LACT|nr:polysaccharide pyruvyl transferase family protein [Marinilactibacillus psychrotolerans]SJN37852.1 hypothetical protein FM115_07650 [Marinilactibacillus psychrotolerans 42ea]
MKKVLLINQGKTENLGDKAINVIFRDILIENDCEVDLAGFAQTKEQSMSNMPINSIYNIHSYIKKFVPTFFIWLFKYRKKIKDEFMHISKGKKYDLVIIGGGQLIKTKGVFVYTLLTWYNTLRKHLECPIVIAGVGADTNYTVVEKQIYQKLLPKFDSIYVRDNKSKKILHDIFNINAKYIPDIVFAFSKFYPNNRTKTKNKLLVMIFDYMTLKKHFGTEYTKEEYYSNWVNIIKENMEPELDIVLGYTTIGDKIETVNFSSYLKKNTDIKFTVLNTDEVGNFVEVLKTTKKLVSGRMHGMLLGMNHECEIIPYIVSPKIEIFNKEWIESKIDLKEINNKIDNKIKEILQ